MNIQCTLFHCLPKGQPYTSAGLDCTVPENIHTSPPEGIVISSGWWFSKTKKFKQMYKAYLGELWVNSKKLWINSPIGSCSHSFSSSPKLPLLSL